MFFIYNNDNIELMTPGWDWVPIYHTLRFTKSQSPLEPTPQDSASSKTTPGKTVKFEKR